MNYQKKFLRDDNPCGKFWQEDSDIHVKVLMSRADYDHDTVRKQPTGSAYEYLLDKTFEESKTKNKTQLSSADKMINKSIIINSKEKLKSCCCLVAVIKMTNEGKFDKLIRLEGATAWGTLKNYFSFFCEKGEEISILGSRQFEKETTLRPKESKLFFGIKCLFDWEEFKNSAHYKKGAKAPHKVGGTIAVAFLTADKVQQTKSPEKLSFDMDAEVKTVILKFAHNVDSCKRCSNSGASGSSSSKDYKKRSLSKEAESHPKKHSVSGGSSKKRENVEKLSVSNKKQKTTR